MDIQQVLQAASNVIELKAGYKYLLVFHDDAQAANYPFYDELGDRLAEMGIVCFSLILRTGDTMEVLEIPDDQT